MLQNANLLLNFVCYPIKYIPADWRPDRPSSSNEISGMKFHLSRSLCFSHNGYPQRCDGWARSRPGFSFHIEFNFCSKEKSHLATYPSGKKKDLS
jgi:hypothetical protein